jgi:hypothetical protein
MPVEGTRSDPLPRHAEADPSQAFYRRAMAANWGLGAMLRFIAGPLLQLIALQVFAADVSLMVVLSMAIGAASVCQFAGLAACYRYGPFVPLIASYRIRTWALVMLAPAPLILPHSTNVAIALWASLVVLLNAVHAAGFCVAWPPIVRAGVAHERRGRITSRLRAAQTIVVFVLTFGIAVLGPDRFGTVTYVSLCLGFAAFSHVATRQVQWMSRHVRLGDAVHGEPVARRIASDWRYITRDRSARSLLGLVVAFGFAGLPLQVFYLDILLGVPRAWTFWFIAMATLAGVASMLAWGACLDRRGAAFTARRGLELVLLGLAFQAGWLATSVGASPASPASIAALIASLIVVNVGAQSLGLVWFNEALRIVPAEHTTAGVMMLGAANELALALSASLSGVMLGHAQHEGPLSYAAYLGFVAIVAASAHLALGRLSRRAEQHLMAVPPGDTAKSGNARIRS